MIEKYDLLISPLLPVFFFFQHLQALILTRGKRGGIPWVKKATS